MEFYQPFMFLHIVCVIVWLGSGMATGVLGLAANRRKDAHAIVLAASQHFGLFARLAAPVALGALACGLAMTLLAWDFHELWILIGLAGFAVSAVFGATILAPRRDRVNAAVARQLPNGADLIAEARQLLVLAQFDTILLMVMVADMVFKPAPDSYATLSAMGVALIAGGILVWRQKRMIETS